jgi:lysozyme family protein
MRTVKELQEFLGVTSDGQWGPKSQEALDTVLHPSRSSNEYSQRFLKMIPFLWEWEGTTFENDPDDPGGATKFGIDQRSHPNENIRNLTEARAIEIYWREYWLKNDCETYPYPMGEVVFNCGVNAGRGRVIEIQEKIGPQATANDFLKEQESFYRRLAASRSTSAKYLKGWLNRIAALRTYLGIADT